MPSLKDTIKSKQGVASASLEELSAQAGRAAPGQPLEAGVLGANPDQAKMAGTPGQKQSALRTAIQGEDDLATRLRRGGPRREATGEEKERLERAGKLGQLGGLEGRVDEMVQAGIDKAAAQEAEVQLQAEGQDEETNEYLNRIRDNPNDFEAIAALNKKLGRTADNQVGAQELMGMFGGEAEQIAAAFGSNVSEAITSGNLPIQEMGFESEEELASILGVSPEEMSGMTITQLIEQVNTAIQTENDTVAEMQARIDDPRLGPAERAEARKQLRDMGAVGIKSAESDIERMADEIANADMIEFGGQEMSVEDLLSDDMVSATIGRYLDGLETDPVSDFAKEFKDNPANKNMIDFIERNQEVLKVASENIGEGQKEFAETQEANKNLAIAPNGESLGDDIMKEILGDTWGTLHSDKYDVSEFPFLEIMNNPGTNEEEANQLSKSARVIQDKFPNMLQEFAKLSSDDLRKLGALSKDPNDLLKFEDKLNEIEKFKEYDQSWEGAANIFGIEGGKEGLMKLRKELLMADNFGMEGVDTKVLDSIPGLREGDWKTVNKYLNQAKPESWTEIVNKMDTISDKVSKVQSAIKDNLDLPSGLENAFVKDGRVSSADVFNHIDFGTDNYEEISGFMQKNRDKIDDDAYEIMDSKFRKELTTDFIDQVNNLNDGQFNSFEDITGWMDDAANLEFPYTEGDEESLSKANADIDAKRDEVSEIIEVLANFKAKGNSEINKSIKPFEDKLLYTLKKLAPKKQQVVDTQMELELDKEEKAPVEKLETGYQRFKREQREKNRTPVSPKKTTPSRVFDEVLAEIDNGQVKGRKTY